MYYKDVFRNIKIGTMKYTLKVQTTDLSKVKSNKEII